MAYYTYMIYKLAHPQTRDLPKPCGPLADPKQTPLKPLGGSRLVKKKKCHVKRKKENHAKSCVLIICYGSLDTP